MKSLLGLPNPWQSGSGKGSFLGILLLNVLVCTGCGGRPARVSGTVTLDGKPVDHGMVSFTPASGGMLASGVIQSDGSYDLKTNRDSGLEPGEYLVAVESRVPGKENAIGAPPMPGPFITPERYSLTQSSGLKYQVERGSNTIDIALTSK
jgi:hypothetical protein